MAVTAANDAPTITDIVDTTTAEDSATSALAFTIGDVETAAASLTVTATSSNTTLIPDANLVFGGTGAARTLTATPALNQFGTATITVTVNDGTTTTSDTFVLTVTAVNDAPTLAAIADPAPILEDATAQTVSLTGIAAGGGETQVLTVTATSSNTALIPNPTVTYTSAATTGSLGYTPVANANGTAVITVTVTDNGGTANGGVATTTQTFTVAVTAANDAPTLTTVSALTGATEDTALTISYAALAAAANAADVDGDALSFRVEAVSTGTLTTSGVAVIAGTTLLSTGQDLVWTPAANANGTLNAFTIKAWDGTTTSATAIQVQVTVAAVNDAPTLAAIAVSGTEDTTFTFTVANFTGAYTDPESTALASITVATLPATGLLKLSGTNVTANQVIPAANLANLTYVPAANENGAKTFTVAASDGTLSSAAATVTMTLTAVNDAPALAPIAASGTEDTTLTFTAANFTGAYTDPDSTPLASITVATLPATGTLKLSGTDVTASQVIPAANLANLTYVPAANENGAKTFAVSASDGALSSAEATVTVTLAEVNDAPSITSGGSASFAENATGTVYTATGSDPESASLTYALGGTDAALFNINASSGAVTFKVSPNFEVPGDSGADNIYDITVTASDGSLSSAPRAVAITVTAVNDAPTLASIAVAGTEDTTFTFTAANFTGAYADPENTPLASITVATLPATGTLKLGTVNVTASQVVTAADLPNLAYVPAANENGAKTFTVTASDGTSSSAAATVTMTLAAVNDAPSFALPAATTGAAGATWTARESNRDWYAITSSADGTKLAAVVNGGQIYTSTDSGVTWTARDSNRGWWSITSSAAGTNLAAGVYGGQIYTSTDSGATWTARESNRNWQFIASSADGTKLTAVARGGQIYTSTDSGASWTAQESGSREWIAIASSADGTKLVAVVEDGLIYTSTDSGATWTPRESSRNWQSIASSADGTKLAAGVDGGQIYTSTDSGATWTPRESIRNWRSMASSADGTKLASGVFSQQIYTSTDSGVTWTARASGGRHWWSIASSADGTKLATPVYGGQIYTSTAPYVLTVLEDAGAQTQSGFATSRSAGPTDESAQTLSFTVTNNNNALFSAQPAINASGTLTFTPAANASGTASVTVTAQDTGGVATSAAQIFTITLSAANDAPTITDIADTSIAEDSATSALAFTIGDVETAAASLTVTAISSNTTLIPNTNLVFGGTGVARTLTATPATNQFGTSTITVTVSDGTTTTSDTFVLTVTTVNDAPTIAGLIATTTAEDTATAALAFTIGDVETAAAALTVTATSSNTVLVPNAALVFSGTGAARTLTATPALNQFGTATITVTVNDGTATTTDTFLLTVTAVNDAPTITDIADTSIAEDSATSGLAFTIGDVETAAASLTVAAISSNTTLIPNTNLVFGGTGVARTLTATPAANQFGSATITVTVNDGTTTTSDTFVLTVASVNDAPTITSMANQTTMSGTATAALALTVGDVETAPGSLGLSATSSNLTFVPNANIVLGGSGAARTVTVTPVAGQSGTATITLTVTDEGALTATSFFTVTVLNTAPVVAIAIPDQAGVYGNAFSYAFPANTFTDSDAGDTLTTTVSNLPAGITFNATTRTFSGTPTAPSTTTVTVTATDRFGLTVSDAFVLTIAKAPLTVTADAKTKVYGAANPALTATITGFVNGETLGTSGITGSVSVTTTAGVSTGIGSASLTAAVGTLASANYVFTTFTDGALTITKAPLTVTADAKTKIYGATNPTFTVTITGFVNSETSTAISGAASVATAATTTSTVGDYAITAAVGTLSAANYSFSFTNGTLTVGKAPLTVTAEAKSRTYGAANPVLTATITGFENSETIAVLTGTPALSTAATTASGVASYAITAALGTLASGNYSFGFVDGALAVTKAPLTVMADAKSRAYGAAEPTFTATLTGFVNGETLATSGVSGTAAVTTTATLTSAAGTYPLSPVVGTLTASNYAFTSFTNGTLTIGQASQTITFGALANKTYGAAAFTVAASASSGLTPSYSIVSGPATLSGSTLTLTGVGTVVVRASQAGDASTTAAAAVDQSFTVAKATLTVTADAKSRVYGAANPTLTATITGYVNSETSTAISGAAAVATAATTTSTVGDYAITAAAGTLSATNYDFSFTAGTLTVSKAPLTVTADAKSRTYGDATPILTATITGYVNSETSAVVSGTAAVTTTATSSSNVGGYPITAALGSLSATNYSFSFTSGTLTVGKAALTVTADNQTKIYGAANPALTATITGFKNSETTAVLTGTPALSTVATTATGVASYAITAALGTLASGSYSFGFVDGALAVTKAPLTVTADNKTRAYGAADPTFTATITGFVNSETSAVVTGAASFSSTATLTSAAGTYPLSPVVGTLTATNYAFTTFTNGTLTIGQASQTITFGTLANKTFGDAAFVLSATASSGLAVTYASSDTAVATVSGNTVTIVGAGTTTITASQSGSTNYNAATSVSQTLTVTLASPAITTQPSSQTVTAGNPVSLSVGATSSAPLAYQWRKGGTAIGGATNATYTIAGTVAADAGDYDVVVSNAAGSVTSLVASLVVAPATVPVILIQPISQSSTGPGGTVMFVVSATGSPAPTFQWYFNGVAILGATSAELTLNNVQASAAGNYTVAATNRAGTVKLSIATFTLTQPGNSATHAVVGSGYVAGRTVTLTNTLTYSGTATALSWAVLLPTGWSFAASAGSAGDQGPLVGQTSEVHWAWTNIPKSPVSFTYTLNVPAGQSGLHELVALVGVSNGTSLQFLATPDPLGVPPVMTHGADTDQNYRISLVELTRVIELFNTFNGTVRTGAYVVQASAGALQTEDGFAADPSRLSTATVTLSVYHSADSDRDGKIGLFELTRVIELYNYRTGTNRTGAYHVQTGTEDGFELGP